MPNNQDDTRDGYTAADGTKIASQAAAALMDQDLRHEAKNSLWRNRVPTSERKASYWREYCAAHLARYGEPFLLDGNPGIATTLQWSDYGFDLIYAAVIRRAPDRPLEPFFHDYSEYERRAAVHEVVTSGGKVADYDWLLSLMDPDLVQQAIAEAKACPSAVAGAPTHQAVWERYCPAHLRRYGTAFLGDVDPECDGKPWPYPANYGGVVSYRPRVGAPRTPGLPSWDFETANGMLAYSAARYFMEDDLLEKAYDASASDPPNPDGGPDIQRVWLHYCELHHTRHGDSFEERVRKGMADP